MKKERRQFLSCVRTDTFVFYFVSWNHEMGSCLIFWNVHSHSLYGLSSWLVSKWFLRLYFLVFSNFWIPQALFRFESGLFRFFRKNSLKVKIVCTTIRSVHWWWYCGNFLNLGPWYRFTSKTDERLSPKSKIVFRRSFLLFSFSGLQKKASIWKCAFSKENKMWNLTSLDFWKGSFDVLQVN